MLRALLFLSFVGGTLYAALLGMHSGLTPDQSGEYSYVLAIRPHVTDTAGGAMRSWGSDLQSLRSPPGNLLSASQPKANRDHRPASTALVVPASSSGSDVPEQGSGLWAKVVLAARAHAEASISSPITHFYRAGTELQVIRREGGWANLQDPATQERGWVFDQYLSWTDSPSTTQVAAAEAPDPVPAAEAAAPKPKPVKAAQAKSKKPGRLIKRPVQASPEMVLAKAVPARGRWAMRGERRGLGLFRSGRVARVEAPAPIAAR